MTPRARMAKATEALQTSLWVVPGALICAAVALAFGVLAIDRHAPSWQRSAPWMFGVSAEGARATLSSIASSVMTVAGVTFSITVVVLQLASSQYSPRVVRRFLRDRLIQTVLGAYLGTFTYVLLVLRTIRSEGPGSPGFTAPLGVSIAVLLGVTCMVLLVVFIHHVAQSLQASSIVASLAEETREAIDALYPEDLGEAAPPPDGPADVAPEGQGPPRVVRAPTRGFLEYVDLDVVRILRPGSTVRIVVCVGDFVRKGDVVAELWGSDGEAACGRLASAFSFNEERTMQQDARFGFRQLADIAIRALSPGINDPTTAVYCINVLGDLLCRLAGRRWPGALRQDPERGLVVWAARPDFGAIVDLAFAQLVRYGRSDPDVLRAVLSALEAIAARDRDGRHGPALAALAEQIAAAARQAEGCPAAERDRVCAQATALAAALARQARRDGRAPRSPDGPRV